MGMQYGGGQKRPLDPPGPRVTMWVLGTELKASVRAKQNALNPWSHLSSPLPNIVVDILVGVWWWLSHIGLCSYYRSPETR